MTVKFNKKTVEDLREKVGKGAFKNDDVDRHQSYGMISLGQSGYGGNGTTLFGSGIKHRTAMTFKISHAERNRDAYHDHYFARGRIVEVSISPSQFTGLLAGINTQGVPCTLNWVTGEGSIESPPDHNVKQELQNDLEDKFKDLAKRCNALEKSINESLKGAVTAKDKEEIKFSVLKLAQDITSNLPYLQKCQTETLEKVGSQVAAEVDAMLTGMIKAVGLEHLQKQLPSMLEAPMDVKEITDDEV